MDERIESKNKEAKRGSDDDDDDDDDDYGALRCKVFDGNFSCWTKGTKQMYVCVRACVCACASLGSLSAAHPLRNSNGDPCSVKIYSPLGPT